jgi:hypothetical protein
MQTFNIYLDLCVDDIDIEVVLLENDFKKDKDKSTSNDINSISTSATSPYFDSNFIDLQPDNIINIFNEHRHKLKLISKTKFFLKLNEKIVIAICKGLFLLVNEFQRALQSKHWIQVSLNLHIKCGII